MKEYLTDEIRNVAFVGHTGSGKTTLMEHVLFQTGAIPALGTVEQGNTISDFDDEEHKRRLSVQSAVSFCEYKGVKINMIDTPGAADFVGDARAALRVADGCVVLLDAVAGIEIGTETIWHYADEYHVPRIAFVNKMDKEHADFFKVLEQVKDKYHKPCVAIQLPIGQAADFKGVIDLVHMKAYYPDPAGKGCKAEAIPAELLEQARKYREALAEAAAGSDDKLIEKILEGVELTDEEIIAGIKNCVLDYKFIPVACGSMAKKLGILLLLDLIEDSLPSPTYVGEYAGVNPDNGQREVRHPDMKEPFMGYVFKTYSDQYSGKIALIRVRSGVLAKDQEVLNPRTGSKVKVAHLYALEGKKQVEIERADAGDFAAVLKVEELVTGDTLCDKDKKFKADPLKLPAPVYFLSIHAANKKDEEKLDQLLLKAAEDDPTFHVRFDNETKEMVIEAMGQQQVDVVLARIYNRSKIEVVTAVPKIAYRETVTKPSKGRYKHKKQSGGHGQYGDVAIELAPLADGADYAFEDKIVGGAIPRGFIPGIEKGLHEGMTEGVLAGYPMTGLRIALVDGSYHDVDSSEMAFKIAARGALKEAVALAGPTLLEPIMDLTVFVEEAFMGDVLSDLNSRRGRVLGMGGDDSDDHIKTVKAKAPLAELLKYSADLKSMTSGKATFEMAFSHYDPVQGKEAQAIIESRKKDLAEHKAE